MSEELLSNDRRLQKHLTPPGFETMTSRFITICTTDCALENSKNVLEEKRKIVERKICIKKDQHVYHNFHELRSRAIKD